MFHREEAQRPVRQRPAWVEAPSGKSSATARRAFELRSWAPPLLTRFATCPWLGPRACRGGVERDVRVHLRQRHCRAVCMNGRLAGLAPIKLLLTAPADAVLADVMDIDPPVVAPGTYERAAWLASKRAEPGVAVVDEYGHFQGLILPTGSPASCSGSTTRISTGSPPFRPPLLTPEPPARKQWADACGTGCRGWPSAWPARWPRLARWLASRTRATNLAGPTSSPESCTWPMRSGTETETLAFRGLSLGVGIGRIARREARSPDCSSAAFSRPRCCPSSAGCGAILHDVDVNTQIEAAVGGAGIVQPFLIRSANHKSVEQLSSAGAPIELSSLTVCEKGL